MKNSGSKESLVKGKSGFNFNTLLTLLFVIVIISMLTASCKKEEDPPPPDPSDNLALDSIVASKRVFETAEEITITAYARGQNLSFHWVANHGTLLSNDQSSVKYWACYSCAGLNTIECAVSNTYGSVSDTIMLRVNP